MPTITPCVPTTIKISMRGFYVYTYVRKYFGGPFFVCLFFCHCIFVVVVVLGAFVLNFLALV